MIRRSTNQREKALVLKFGGSHATDSDGANREYLHQFFKTLDLDLKAMFARAAFIIGGGPRIRELQKQGNTDHEKDMIAREALWEHAEQLGEVVQDQGWDTTEHIPRSQEDARALMLQQQEFAVALSWLQAGQSTDTAAIVAAETWQQRGYDALVVILSNVARIFTADPRTNPEASPIRSSSVENLIQEGVLIHDPDAFRPGMSVTIDPVAVNRLQALAEKAPPLYFGHAADIENVRQFLTGKETTDGTVVAPKNSSTSYYTSRLTETR